jgi:hypothetical protein
MDEDNLLAEVCTEEAGHTPVSWRCSVLNVVTVDPPSAPPKKKHIK